MPYSCCVIDCHSRYIKDKMTRICVTRQSFLMAICYLCIRNLLFDTAKTNAWSLKYRWSLIYRFYYTWMPSVYKTKSTWPDKEWKLEAYYLYIPIQKFTTYHNIFIGISRTHGGPATKILSTIDHGLIIIH